MLRKTPTRTESAARMTQPLRRCDCCTRHGRWWTLRDGGRSAVGVNGYTIDAQQSPPSEVHTSLNSENATSLQTYDDTRTYLPPSFLRFSLLSDDDSELLHSEISDVIFSEEQEMLPTTDQNVHDVDKVQNSWRPPDGIIGPDETVSESHEEIPLRVTAKYDRKSGGMGRAARAGVRVGLFVCLCLCRERPPCEGFFPSVTAEEPEVKIWIFPSVSRASCGAMAKGACPRGFPQLPRRR